MRLRLPQLSSIIATVVLFSPGVLSSAQIAPGIHFSDLAGTWTLVSIYRTANVQGPSVSEAKRLLGTHVVYGAHKMTSCGIDATITGAQELELSREDLLQDDRVRFSELGLQGKTVEGIILELATSETCFGAFPPPGRVLYIKSKTELIIDFESVFYRAVRLH